MRRRITRLAHEPATARRLESSCDATADVADPQFGFDVGRRRRARVGSRLHGGALLFRVGRFAPVAGGAGEFTEGLSHSRVAPTGPPGTGGRNRQTDSEIRPRFL